MPCAITTFQQPVARYSPNIWPHIKGNRVINLSSAAPRRECATRRHYLLESREKRSVSLNNSMWTPPGKLQTGVREMLDSDSGCGCRFFPAKLQNQHYFPLGGSAKCTCSMKDWIPRALKSGGRPSERLQHLPRVRRTGELHLLISTGTSGKPIARGSGKGREPRALSWGCWESKSRRGQETSVGTQAPCPNQSARAAGWSPTIPLSHGRQWHVPGAGGPGLTLWKGRFHT